MKIIVRQVADGVSMLPVAARFGNFILRIRNKLGLNQQEFAQLLGLKSREAVANIEGKARPSMQGDTLEALLDLLGYARPDELDAAWKSETLPDMEETRKRAMRKLGRPLPATSDNDGLPPEADEAIARLAAMAGMTRGRWLNAFGGWVARQSEFTLGTLTREIQDVDKLSGPTK